MGKDNGMEEVPANAMFGCVDNFIVGVQKQSLEWQIIT
jgi:hypothetical protein